jgi:hypothetical protein
MRQAIAKAVILLSMTVSALGQDAAPRYRGQGYVFFGQGTGFGTGRHPYFDQVGFGGEGFLYKGLAFGAEASRANNENWIGSADMSYHFRRRAARGGIDPFGYAGCSIYGHDFENHWAGQAGANYGGGINWWLAKHAALRLEVRDYLYGYDFLPGNNAFSAVSFRAGMTFR